MVIMNFMQQIKYKVLLILFIAFTVHQTHAQEEVETDTSEVFTIEYKPPIYQYDSSTTEYRSFDKAKLDELSASEDFVYFKEKSETYSLWEQIMYWIAEMLSILFFTEGNSTGIRYFIYGLAAITFCYVLMRLMGIETSQLLYRAGKKSKIDTKVLVEDLEGIDFSQAIQDAVQQQDYKAAVRFLYLFMLKKMDEKSIIEWKENKTNHELELELNEPSLKKDFERATYLFERIYYGAFQVKPQQFEKAKATFGDIDEKLSTFQNQPEKL